MLTDHVTENYYGKYYFIKNRLPMHSECDLFDKFELELDSMQQKTTECFLLIKVACLEQKNLLK